jgi:TatD DNase family protein
MIPYIDLHTHRLYQGEDVISVYNLMLHETLSVPMHPFSAGLHPWHAGQVSSEALSLILDQCAASPDCIAFGETGLDKVWKTPMKLQLDIFELHLKKAAEQGKPLILHCVKAWDELIGISAGYPVVKILHGYNGNDQLTDRLLQNGFHFSIGKAILHPEAKIHSAIRHIPMSAIYCETDTSGASIGEVYSGLSDALHLDEEEVKRVIFTNFTKLVSA